MDFEDYFGRKVDAVDLQAQDRWQAIEELMNHLVDTHQIQSQHRDSIAESIRKRESANVSKLLHRQDFRDGLSDRFM